MATPTPKQIKMAKRKTVRRLSHRQLWFIWKSINELREYLRNQMEAGARGAEKDFDNGKRSMELIQQQRLYLKALKSKHLKK